MDPKHERARRQDFGDREARRRHGRPEDATRKHRGGRRSPRRRSASYSSSSSGDTRKDRSRRDYRRSRHERSSSSSEEYSRRKRRKNTRRSRSLSRSRNRSRSRSLSRQRRSDRRNDDRAGNREIDDRHHRSRKYDDYNPQQHPRDRDLGDHARRGRGRSLSGGRERPRRERRKRRQRRSRRSRSYSSRSSSSSASSSRRPRQRAAVIATRAGVVSDDDDANLAGGHSFGPGSRGGPMPPHAGRPEENNMRMGQNHPSNNKRKRDSASSAAHDDTVGHFWGGPGTVIADTYRVERELGVGTFGRVVECLDLNKSRGRGQRLQQENDNNNLVAIKMVRKVKRYYESALIEADIVSDVNRRGGPRGRGTSHFAIMYDRFSFRGHYCLVFESLGPSLYDYLKRNKYHPFPMRCVRDFSKQLLEAIEFLHSFRLIHTDLKPENILLTKCREVSYGHQKLPESTRIKVIDFGGATYDNEKKSSVVNTRQYRAPEVILSCGWSMPSDLWSAGCILCELYTGELLFATHDNLEHLALIERIIGPFPRQMLRRANHFNSTFANQAFDANGRHRLGRVLPPESASYVMNMPPLESIVKKKKDGWFLNLLRSILVIDPESRSSARDALRNCCLADRPL